MAEKLNVLTVRGVCRELGISRSHFETKVKNRLTQVTPGGRGLRRLFLYDQVIDLKKEGVLTDSKFNVIA